MRIKDTFDASASLVAVVADAVAVFGGFMLATWIRFDSEWLSVPLGRPPDRYTVYANGAAVATLLFLFIYRSLGLFVRPQLGTFGDKIPRIIRATGLGILLSTVVAFVVKNVVPFSSAVLIISFFTILAMVLLERAVLFQIEIHAARSTSAINKVLILGTGSTAARLQRAIAREPRLRSITVGFLRTDLSEPDKDIPPDSIKGTVEELHKLIEEGRGEINQVILTDSRLAHERIVDIIMLCERNLVSFKLVPDIFRILTTNVDVQTVEDIPLLGIRRWPLDMLWNRVLKRAEDIAGALAGLVLSAPVIAAAAVVIKCTSRGPVFYRQERCGERGRSFTLYKLRTMTQDAEAESGPGWTTENDPRRTKAGAFLRRHSLDELPQLWNVLKGDMSLVGPRPERPHFVKQFREDIGGYMWRHVSKPGMTGWAQINGLRGNTSISERIKYDLYYLENWALAFDFKILVKTLFMRENAY